MNDIEQLKQRYSAAVAARRAACRADLIACQKAGSADEANLEKIRLNILDVFVTLLHATRAEEPEAFCRAYLARFDTIPASWRARLGAARAHGDAETVLIEQLKLDTAESLRGLFRAEMEACGYDRA